MTPPMRTVYSTFAIDDLLNFVSARYKRLGITVCHYWQNVQSGGNDLYRVANEQHRYMLRVYLSDCTYAELDAQARLCNDLAAQGIAVPPVLAADDGTLVQEIVAPEGMRYLILTGFVEGDSPGSAITTSQSHRYGQTLATLHQQSDAQGTSYALPVVDEHALLEKPLAEILPFLAHLPQQTDYLTQLVSELSDKLRRLPRTTPAFGLCHGDSHKSNILCRDETLTLIDFDCAAYSWRAYDLAVFRWSTGRPQYFGGLEPERAGAVWQAFLAGYQAVYPLSADDLQTITDFVLIRHIWWMAIDFRLIRLGRIGRGWVSDEFLAARLQILEELKPLR